MERMFPGSKRNERFMNYFFLVNLKIPKEIIIINIMNYHYDLGKDIVSMLLQRFSGKKIGTKECNMDSMMEYLLHEDKVEVEINKKKVIIEK